MPASARARAWRSERGWAAAHGGAALARLVPALDSRFVLAVLAAAGARLRDGDRAGVAAELTALEARAAARLAHVDGGGGAAPVQS